MALNEFYFGLDDLKIAVWNGVESYGTALDVEAVSQFGVTIQMESGILEGDDIDVAVHARARAVEIQMQLGFKDLDTLAALSGATNTDSAPTSESMIIGRLSMPYFAVCGKVVGVDLGGDFHLFVPKCKVMDQISLSAQKGQFITPQFTARGVYEGATYGMLKLIKHATAANVTIPPT